MDKNLALIQAQDPTGSSILSEQHDVVSKHTPTIPEDGNIFSLKYSQPYNNILYFVIVYLLLCVVCKLILNKQFMFINVVLSYLCKH